MSRRYPRPRRVLAVLATLGLLMSLFPTLTIAAGAPGAPTTTLLVQPVALDGNRNCAAGDSEFEFRINAPGSGTFTQTSSGVTIELTVYNTASGQAFDFEILNGFVADAIYVKAGPDTNFYDYEPPASADTFLHGTVNPNNGRFYGLSHLSFCLNEVQNPDVSVAKTPDGGSVDAGENAVFSITVTNNGPGPANNVTLSDTLPNSGLSWSLGGADAGDCSIAAGPPQVLTCDFGTLAQGATRTVTLTSATDSGDCGLIENTVMVSADGDINLANNTDDGDITVNCPNVKVEKTGNGTIDAGQDASFDILVTNEGPGAASNVTLSDSLPDSGLDWSLSGADAADCEITGAVGSEVLSCDFGTLAEGATRTITVTASTDSDDCGDIDNTVTISATGDISAADNTSSDTVTVRCGALQITKTAKHADTSGGTSPDLSGTFTVTDAEGNIHVVETNAAGVGCVDGVAIGLTQSIVEDPNDFPGYSVPDIANVNVVAGECDGSTLDTGGTNVPVDNTPLTDISWSVDSLVDGGTSTVVTCYDGDGNILDGYPITITGDGDDDGTLPNLLPTDPDVTVSCDFVVDP